MKTSMIAVVLGSIALLVGCTSSSSGGSTAPATGTLTCAQDSQCGGEDCEHVSVAEIGVCVKHCSSDADCGDNHLCLSGDSVGLQASCFPACTGDASCPSGFGCYDVNGTSQNACLPKAWNGDGGSGGGGGSSPGGGGSSSGGGGSSGGSQSGGCQSDSDCPGECYGTDFFCCPTCKSGGYCGSFCCDSNGNCY